MSDEGHLLYCDVYLCTTDNDFGQCMKIMFSSMAIKTVHGNLWNKHWLLVFDYGEDFVHVLEAGKDSDKKLTGQRSYKKRADFEAIDPNTKHHLGKHHVPQWRLDALFRKMADCGTYDVKTNNCQTWAASFLNELGITLPENVHQANDAWYRGILPSLAVAGSAAVGVIAVGITSAMSTRKQRN